MIAAQTGTREQRLTTEPGSVDYMEIDAPGGVPHPRLPTPRLPTPLQKQQARTPGVRALPMSRDIAIVSEGVSCRRTDTYITDTSDSQVSDDSTRGVTR